MATLTLDLAPELYARLRAEAQRLGQPGGTPPSEFIRAMRGPKV